MVTEINWSLYIDGLDDPWMTPELIAEAKRRYCEYRYDIPPDFYDNVPESATGCRPPDDDTVADGWREYGGLDPSDNHD